MTSEMACWAVVPAAGIGRRMGSDIPKQYLRLGGKLVIEHAIESLFASSAVRGIAVAVAEGDSWWEALRLSIDRPLIRVTGGAERSDSVLNALRALQDRICSNEWVLVHDAARPCLRRTDLDHLFAELEGDATGGLLAVPVHDTMKKSNGEDRVVATVDRDALLHALTPQMFRYGTLVDALEVARRESVSITDEASAMEFLGHTPKLVEGHGDNVKITRHEDLALAEFYLRQQGRL